VKLTILDSECANKTCMCSEPPIPVFRHPFPGSASGRDAKEKDLNGVAVVEYARFLVVIAVAIVSDFRSDVRMEGSDRVRSVGRRQY